MTYASYSSPQSFGIFSALDRFDLCVFPVQYGSKEPAVNWKKYQTERPSASDLSFWDTQKYNVGVVCGAISRIIVFDIDSDEAQRVFDELDLPQTPVVSTAKGRHYYFRYPGFEVRNTVRISGHKLDLRGDGGFVAAPGSVHETGVKYEWVISPAECDFAPVPDQLLALLREHQPARVSTPKVTLDLTGLAPGLSSLLERRLDEAQKRIADAPEGERNTTLFKMAVSMANDVAAAEVDWTPFQDAIMAAAQQAGLPDGESRATIDSAWESGSQRPTPWIDLGRKWVYVAGQDEFRHLTSGQQLRPTAFNTAYNSLLSGEKGSIAAFLTRNDYIQKVQELTFDPGLPPGFVSRDGLDWLNTYRSSGIEPEEGDASPFVDFLAYLAPDPAERDHLVKMMAWTVRRPGKKLMHSLLFRTRHQGVGKSTFIEIWRHLLGMHNTRKVTSDEIEGPWQGYLNATLFVVVEELSLGSGRNHYNRLKDMITGTTAPINEKYKAIREVENRTNFVFLTNMERALLIEPEDRRFFIVDNPADPRPASYYAEFNAWWRTNLGVIRGWLDGIDLSDFNPAAPPPETEAKRRLARASLNPLEQELVEALDQCEFPFSRDIVTLSEVRQALPEATRGKSLAQIQGSLRAIGGVSLGQHRVPGKWRPSPWGGDWHFVEKPARECLWAVAHAAFWEQASPRERAEEYARKDGFLVVLALPGSLGVRHIDEAPVLPAGGYASS